MKELNRIPILKWLSFLIIVKIYYSVAVDVTDNVYISEDDGGNTNKQRNGKAYFNFCNSKDADGQKESITVGEKTCPSRAWLTEDVRSYQGCVCLNGLWAIYHGWCDEDYSIAYGREHCFKLDKQIQKVSFLGDPVNSFQSVNFINTGNEHVFKQFSTEFEMSHEIRRNTTIVRIRPDKESHVLFEISPRKYNPNIFESGNGKCLSSDLSTEAEGVLIYKTNFKAKSVKIIKACPANKFWWGDNSRSTITQLLPGQVVHIKSDQISYYNDICNLQCMKKPLLFSETPIDEEDTVSVLVRRRRQAPKPSPSKQSPKPQEAAPDISNEDEAEEASQVVFATQEKNNAKNIITPKPTKPPQEGRKFGDNNVTTQKPFPPFEFDMELSEAEKDSVVGTSTLHVLKQELNWILDGVRAPTLDSPLWTLMRKFRQIFVKVCPDAQAPNFMVGAMMRVFRLLYLNSKEFYPNGHMPEEKTLFDRWIGTLDACLNDAITFNNFHYFLSRPTKDPICRTVENGKGNTTYCRCDYDRLHCLQLEYTTSPSGPRQYHRLLREQLELLNPPLYSALAYKMGKKQNETFGIYHDFPTETAWKMINFGHYYCAKHFRERPEDLSSLMIKMEELFTEDIIYRWTRPGRGSDRIWQFLYHGINLKLFAEAVDICVSASRLLSDYKEWIYRPTLDYQRRKKRSLKNAPSGTVHCLQDSWTPANNLRGAEKCADSQQNIR